MTMFNYCIRGNLSRIIPWPWWRISSLSQDECSFPWQHSHSQWMHEQNELRFLTRYYIQPTMKGSEVRATKCSCKITWPVWEEKNPSSLYFIIKYIDSVWVGDRTSRLVLVSVRRAIFGLPAVFSLSLSVCFREAYFIHKLHQKG